MASISKVKVKNVTYDIGGGSEIYIGNEQDAPESTELLIDSEDIDMLGSEVVDTLDGNETDKAPSVRAVKEDLNTYSTTEQRIGTWINGKPLYRKVYPFVAGDLPNKTGKIVANLGNNIELAIIDFGSSYMTWQTPRSYGIEKALENSQYVDFSIDNLYNIYCQTNIDLSSYWGAIVVKYTKTTDTVS